jgi:F0F1-type ATP synthase assembly protein I
MQLISPPPNRLAETQQSRVSLMSAEQRIDPYKSSDETPVKSASEASQHLPLAMASAVFASIVGGIGCGWLIDRLGELGSIALWPLGFAAGTISRKLTVAPSRVAWFQVAACVLAMLIAETCWLHWNTVQGEKGWWESMILLPAFVDDYTVSAVVAATFTAFGCFSAYGTAGRRYRLVREYID